MRRALFILLLIVAGVWGCRGARRDDLMCHLSGTQWQGRGNLQTFSGDADLGWTATTTNVRVDAEVARVGGDAFLRGTFTGDGFTVRGRMDLSKAAGVFLAHDVEVNAPGKLLTGTGVMIKPGADGGMRAMPSTWERDSITFYGRHLEFPLTCFDISVTAGALSLDERLKSANLTAIGFADLREGAIRLSDSADGQAVAELGAEHPARVAVLERGPERTRIAFPGDHGAVWIGWIASSYAKDATGAGTPAGTPSPKPTSPPALVLLVDRDDRPRVCNRALPVRARVEDRLVEVGTLAAGTPFMPHTLWHEQLNITFDSWFHTNKDVRLMVEPSAAQCPLVADPGELGRRGRDGGTAR